MSRSSLLAASITSGTAGGSYAMCYESEARGIRLWLPGMHPRRSNRSEESEDPDLFPHELGY